ncbi:MAG: hypothetical protein AABZ57_03225, partial [Candidatus Margulisiibacteriota bacterium]
MKNTLVIFDSYIPEKRLSGLFLPNDDAVLCNSGNDEQCEESLALLLSSKGINSTSLRYIRKFNETAFAIRDDYIDFISTFPQKTLLF